ncbi:unnamed protein product [Zymoseptoria tritici ST99CH_1E4]|uniref:Uncharacterized protein n=1 Tax=Zymoseptoria tritici ST99CH_1E4 TaxID=1276532 RepID=A0A2H1H983_ZYMTR|nr:unnamed protein product [Zymoseptoria tritici ST99CH_1E4]
MQATYGKTARSAESWNFADVDFLDDEIPTPSIPISRNARSQQPASAQKAEATSSKLKPVKRKAEPKKKDAWDVSSTESSDVDELSPVKAGAISTTVYEKGTHGRPTRGTSPIWIPWMMRFLHQAYPSLEMLGRSGWKARYIAEASLSEAFA